jgi:hypothetical protein
MKSKLMKNKLTGLLAVCAALFLVFALAGCPQSYDDLPTLEEKLLGEAGGGYIIQAEDGTPYGSVTNNGPKGEGTIGNCMNELNPEGDGSTNYFMLTLPGNIPNGSYTVNFRYASNNDDANFEIKFTVNGGDVLTTGTVANNGWDLGTDLDFATYPDPVALQGGSTLKVWTTNWGAIDFIYLEPVN